METVTLTASRQPALSPPTPGSRLYRREAGKFVIAGLSCVVIQLALIKVLTQFLGTSAYLAGLAVSVPCNFVLSYFWTFRYRGHRGRGASSAARKGGRYVLAAAVTAGVYLMLFALAKVVVAILSVAARITALTPHVGGAHVFTHTRAAEVCALAATAVAAWKLQSRFVFRQPKHHPTDEIQHAPLEDLRRIAEEGIAWFLPAYDEAGNLQIVTDFLVATLRQLAVRFRVIIVNDGSKDGTAVVAARLAASYPEVELVSHQTNLGYGPALRTGLEACHGTEYGLIGFYDADNQFRPHSLLTLLTRMQQTDADVVIGARIKRADRGLRSFNGKAWGAVSRRVLNYRAEDTDAGCKLFRRRVVTAVMPYLDAQRGAGISPQILSFAQNFGFKSAETGVLHYPRTAGRNTGNDLRVIVRSFIDLFRSRLKLHRELVKLGLRRRPVSAETKAVFAAACVISVAAYLHFYPHGNTIAYGDAKSHLLIARRVFYADTPGVGQLGGVWLPLPHILMLPLIWNNWAYYSGFAGSIVMMLAYAVCTVLIYKFIWHLTHRRWAAICGTAVFALNPNVLYMQSTPMTELLMFATMMGAVYGLLRWIQTDDGDRFHHLYLLGAGLSALLCASTRYEGWTVAVALTGIVLYASLTRLNVMSRLAVTGFVTASVVIAGWGFVRFGPVALGVVIPAGLLGYAYLKRLYRRNDWDLTEGQLITFGILGAGMPPAWMMWNWALFGDPLAFQSGPFAKPSLWVDSGEKAVHHIVIALRTYEIASVDNLTPVVAVLALIGLAVYLWRTRLSPESLPALALLVMFPLFVVTLYKGQRPLHVYQYYYNFYNVRFGLVMILPACIMIGFLTAELARLLGKKLRSRRWAPVRSAPAIAVIVSAVLIGVGALQSGNIVTLMEPLAARETPTTLHARAAALWMRMHYTGGLLLMESYGNEEVAFESGVPAPEQVYEGSYRLWQPALANPSGHGIAWIVMRTERNDEDQVYKSLFGSSLLNGYRQVWSNYNYVIYASQQAVAQMQAKRSAAANPAPVIAMGRARSRRPPASSAGHRAHRPARA